MRRRVIHKINEKFFTNVFQIPDIVEKNVFFNRVSFFQVNIYEVRILNITVSCKLCLQRLVYLNPPYAKFGAIEHPKSIRVLK